MNYKIFSVISFSLFLQACSTTQIKQPEPSLTSTTNKSGPLNKAEATIQSVSPPLDKSGPLIKSVSPPLNKAKATIKSVSPPLNKVEETIKSVSPSLDKSKVTIKSDITLLKNKDEDKNQQTFNILPLLKIEPTNITSSLNIDSEKYLHAYTRFYVENKNSVIGVQGTDENGTYIEEPASRNCTKNNNERCYADEHQSWMRRILVEKQISRVISLKVQLQNPNVETTTTLASSGYSTKQKNKGESWTTEFNGNLFLTPYFRIDGGSVARIESRINATSSSESQVSNTAFSIVQNGISLATPVSTLLNSYVAPDLTQSSKIMDGAITSLFSNELAEISANEFPQTTWFKNNQSDYSLASVTGWFPAGHNMTNRNLNKIGAWNIKTTPPVASIFNPVPMKGGDLASEANNALRDIAPSQILNFSITKDLTLKKVLQTDDAVTNALKAINNPNSIDDAYKSLCVSIDEKAQSIGLNKYDTAALIWAFSHDTSLTIDQGNKLRVAKCLATQIIRNLKLLN